MSETLDNNIVTIDDPDALDTQHLPEGTYSAVIESVQFAKQEDDARYLPGDRVVNWVFTLDDESEPGLRGRRFWETTSVEAGRGWKYKRFMIGLGATDDSGKVLAKFDLNTLEGMEVSIDISETLGKPNRDTGKSRVFNNVAEVTQR